MLFNKLLVKLLLDFVVPKFGLHLKEIKKTEGLNTPYLSLIAYAYLNSKSDNNKRKLYRFIL